MHRAECQQCHRTYPTNAHGQPWTHLVSGTGRACGIKPCEQRECCRVYAGQAQR